MDNNSFKIKYGIQDEGMMEASNQEVIHFSYYGSLMQEYWNSPSKCNHGSDLGS